MNKQALIDRVSKMILDGEYETDNYGQVVVYTGAKEVGPGEYKDLEEEDLLAEK